MKTIGITGGVGAGKSTVLDYLEKECHAFVIQADQVGHLVMEPGQECYQPIIQLFGKEIIKKDKSIDRRMVSDVVFSHAEKLEQLNAIIHPAVKRYIRRCLEEQKQAGREICVVEAALLLEDHYQEFCDEIWYVYTQESLRRQRLQESRGYSDEKITQMMKTQLPDAYFREHCQFVVDNSSDNVENTYEQIDEGLRKHGIL